MNKINSLRAKLLFEKFYKNKKESNVALTFDGMMNTILTIPSYFETECCTNKIKNFIIIHLNNATFNNDFSNMEQAIEENFVKIPTCRRCKKGPKYTRNFTNQVFIDVRLNYIFTISF